MILELTGVIADASHPAPTVQPKEPTRQDIKLPRGEPLTIKLTVLKQDHSPYDLSTATVRLGVRQFLDDPAAGITKQATITDFPGGLADIVVAAVDTQSLLQNGDYFFDVQLTDGTARYQIVPVSTFRILATVNQPADVPSLGSVEQYLSFPPDTMAGWSTSLVRYVVINPATGSDSSTQYFEDAVAGSTLTTAPAHPLASQAGLMAKMPRNGAGRGLVILYVNPDRTLGTTHTAFDFSGIHGYRYCRKSGSTDGSNSTTDRVLNGFMIASAGPNVDGSWTCAAGATTLTATIAAGSLPVEVSSGGITGFRIRFTGNVTASLANICRAIRRNITTSALGWELITGVAPAAGDTFFIERAGVRTPYFHEVDGASAVHSQANGTLTPSVTTGIEVTGTIANSCKLGNPGNCAYSGFHISGATNNQVVTTSGAEAGTITTSSSFVDEVGLTGTPASSRTLGMAMRVDCLGRIKANQLLLVSFTTTRQNSPISSTNLTLEADCILWQSGVTRGARLNVTGLAASVRGSHSSIGVQSAAALIARLRIVDGALCIRGSLQVYGVSHEGIGTQSVIHIGASAFSSAATPEAAFISIDDFIDEPGFVSKTTAAALDITSMKLGGTVRVGVRAVVTASGAAGEILAAPAPGFLPITANWATLDSTNIPDFNGTNLIGSAGDRIPRASCRHVRHNFGTAPAPGDVVRPYVIPNFVVLADAAALPAEHEVAGIMITGINSSGEGLMWVSGGSPFVRTEGAAAEGKTLYLSATTPGRATSTPPLNNGTNRKLPLGCCDAAVASPQGAFVTWYPAALSTVSDGAR